MQKIKLLALDIDGTLIPAFGEPIAQKDIDAIERARAAGVHVTLATGRILRTAIPSMDALKIDAPVIMCNGADIRDREKSWFRDGIPADEARMVMDAYRGKGFKRYIFSDNAIYCTKEDYYAPLFDKWGRGEDRVLPVVVSETEEEMYASMKRDADKVLVWTPDGAHLPELLQIAENFADRFSVVRGEEYNVEFNRRGVSKGSGLKKLAELLGLRMDEVMAIGDGGNDVEMLRAAGVGVAMANAMDEALEAADHVTADVRACGVAQAIEKFIFGE